MSQLLAGLSRCQAGDVASLGRWLGATPACRNAPRRAGRGFAVELRIHFCVFVTQFLSQEVQDACPQFSKPRSFLGPSVVRAKPRGQASHTEFTGRLFRPHRLVPYIPRSLYSSRGDCKILRGLSIPASLERPRGKWGFTTRLDFFLT